MYWILATPIYVRRYTQLHNIGSTQQSYLAGSPIAGVPVLSLASVNDVEDLLTPDDYQTI